MIPAIFNYKILPTFDFLDSRTQDWFLMRSPWLGLGILAIYLMAVLRWLPNYMKNKPAFELREIIVAFNILQIIGCGYVFYQVCIILLKTY